MWGVLVVAGSTLGPCSVKEGSSLCGWLVGILEQTPCLKNIYSAGLSWCFLSQPLNTHWLKLRRSLATNKMPELLGWSCIWLCYSTWENSLQTALFLVFLVCSCRDHCDNFPICPWFLSLLHHTQLSSKWVLSPLPLGWFLSIPVYCLDHLLPVGLGLLPWLQGKHSSHCLHLPF